MYVSNLFRFFTGACLRPPSNTTNSSVDSVLPLKLKTPPPFPISSFWDLFPALHPRFLLEYGLLFPPLIFLGTCIVPEFSSGVIGPLACVSLGIDMVPEGVFLETDPSDLCLKKTFGDHDGIGV